MKASLSSEDREALVRYRVERSKETLREVDYLVKGGFYSAAVNRLYYACYYMAVALLVANNLETMSHAGVKIMLSKHFVKTGLLDKETSKTFLNFLILGIITTMRIIASVTEIRWI